MALEKPQNIAHITQLKQNASDKAENNFFFCVGWKNENVTWYVVGSGWANIHYLKSHECARDVDV